MGLGAHYSVHEERMLAVKYYQIFTPHILLVAWPLEYMINEKSNINVSHVL